MQYATRASMTRMKRPMRSTLVLVLKDRLIVLPTVENPDNLDLIGVNRKGYDDAFAIAADAQPGPHIIAKSSS